MTDDPTQRLDEARRLLDSGEPDAATAIAEPISHDSDPDIAADYAGQEATAERLAPRRS